MVRPGSNRRRWLVPTELSHFLVLQVNWVFLVR